MYLQIIYQHGALQMPNWIIKEKVFQLACKQVRYGFTKNSPHFLHREQNLYDKLRAAATVH